MRLLAFVAVAAALVAALASPRDELAPAEIAAEGSATPEIVRSPLARPWPRPNVLLVSIDSLRRDHVHAYGYERETSPTIDRLAREGVRFDQAVSPSSWTLPAHMSLLTSMPPRQHGVTKTHRRLAGDVETLPRVFQRDGYATAAFVSGPLLSSRYGFAQGFDTYDDHTLPQNDPGVSDRGETAPTLTGLTIGWLDTWKRRDPVQPFFLFLHLWDVHYDYAPPPPYDRMFDPEYGGLVTGDRFVRNAAIHPGMDPRDLAHVIALYDGEIRFTDEHLGRIVEHLAALGVLDDTIVVVTSDHGDEFFEHGRKGHGLTVYDEVVLVPLVLRYPRRIAPGRVVEDQVRLMDVGPTLLGLTGVRAPATYGSREAPGGRHREKNLAPWLAHEPATAPFPELLATPETQMVFGSGAGAVRTRARKLVEHNADHRLELYDLLADPREERDLARGKPEIVAHLSTLRRAWAQHLDSAPNLALPLALDPSTAARLRSLGYAE